MRPAELLRNFHVDPERGFLQNPDPLTELPAQYKEWDSLGSATPELLRNGDFRNAVEGLTELDSSDLLDGPEINRAMLLLSMFANSYVWSGDEPARAIPSSLAVPLCRVAQRCGRPPIASHASIVLCNWRRIDPEKPIALENLTTVQNFLGGEDEDWFLLTTVAIESAGASALEASANGLAAVLEDDDEGIEDVLRGIDMAIGKCLAILDRIPEKCAPEIFYSQIRPFLAGWPKEGVIYEGVDEKPKTFIGGSASQSSLLQSIDAAMGVRHTHADSGPFLMEMRKYMPPGHRLFLKYLETETSLRMYIENRGSAELKNKLNESIDIVDRFRRSHMKIAAQYILEQAGENGDVTGTGGTEFVTFLMRTRADTDESRIP